MMNDFGQNEYSEIAKKFREINRLAESLHEEEKKILAVLSNSCAEFKNEIEQAETKQKAVQDVLKGLNL